MRSTIELTEDEVKVALHEHLRQKTGKAYVIGISFSTSLVLHVVATEVSPPPEWAVRRAAPGFLPHWARKSDGEVFKGDETFIKGMAVGLNFFKDDDDIDVYTAVPFDPERVK